MKDQDIHTLVERFLDGETTLKEERRLYAFFQRDEVPEGLKEYQEMFRAYAAIAPKTAKKQVMRPIWLRVTSIAAAACLVAVSLIGYNLYTDKTSDPSGEVRLVKNETPKQDGEKEVVTQMPPTPVEHLLAEQVKQPRQPQQPQARRVRRKETMLQEKTETTSSVQTPSIGMIHQVSNPVSDPSEGNFIYASHVMKEDTVPYQDPARVDEFITKCANYYQVKEGELKCSIPKDSCVISTVYVFPDKKEVDVFGRLLQAACWYNDATPGYLLTFSHQQFFFELKDIRKQLQYRWIAERVNGKILLYSTCSPINVSVSSTCYQAYREELMHTKSINTKNVDI